MSDDFDLIIIGGGIACEAFLACLGESGFLDQRILVLHAPEIAPPCSFSSTAVIARNGVNRNTSTFGDQLYDSFLLASEFMQESKAPGVANCTQYHIRFAHEKISIVDLKRRFENCQEVHEVPELDCNLPPGSFFFSEAAKCINAKVFMDWLHDRNLKKFSGNLVWREDYITEVNSAEVTGMNGASYKGKNILFATGAARESLFHNQTRPGSKRVPGSYLETEYDLGKKSFVLSLSDFNFIYRHLDQKILIGGTSQSNGVYAKDWAALIEYHRVIKELIPNNPVFTAWSKRTGTRQKGPKRRPYWGACANDYDNHYEISSLYKNGFTLAFLAGRELVSQIYGD